MARVCSSTQIFLLAFAAFLRDSDCSLIKAVPQSHRAAGVFMLNEGEYIFNFSAARAACLFLNVTIVTRDQMERALQHGLETCRYGWTAERVAVIPRLKPDMKCGQGKTGVVTWNADTSRKFSAFCFNASDLQETSTRSTVSPQSSTFPTTLTALTQTSPPATPLLRSTSMSKPSRGTIATKTTERTFFTSALLVKTTHPKRISHTSASLKPFSSHTPTSLPHHITTTPTVITFAFSVPTQASSFFVSSESVMPTSMSPTKPSLGDVSIILIILGIILLLLTAAGIVWYSKLKIFTLWSQGQQKDDIETEMWRHTDSEMDLHSQHEEEEEESDRKYSSDITLCVNPAIRASFTE